MADLSIHEVERVRAAPITDLGTSYSRRIWVTDKSGATHSLILYADTAEELAVVEAADSLGRHPARPEPAAPAPLVPRREPAS